MEQMTKTIKDVDVTFFKKVEEVSVDDVNPGDIVYVKVKSRLNYGIREWEYYGRIVKKTNCYIWFVEYCNAYKNDNWNTESIEQREQSEKCIGKWSKNSVLELWKVTTEKKIVTKEYLGNVR